MTRRGWRYCRVTDHGLLRSTYGRHNTYTTARIEAECLDPHDTKGWPVGRRNNTSPCETIPGPDCTCGIYFIDDATAFARHYANYSSVYSFTDDPGLALTRVTIEGHVLAKTGELIDNQQVWRATSVVIDAVLIHPDKHKAHTSITEHYQVPVLVDRITPQTLTALDQLTRTAP